MTNPSALNTGPPGTGPSGTGQPNAGPPNTGQPELGQPSNPESSLRWSLVISGVRCTLTYVLLPFVAPLIGLAPGVGPIIGIPIALIALAANAFSIKRYWANDHRWKWPVSVLNVGIIILLIVLLVIDIKDLLT